MVATPHRFVIACAVVVCASSASAQPAPPTPASPPLWGSSLSTQPATTAPPVRYAPPPTPPPPVEVTGATVPSARHALYLEANGLILTGSLGVTYAYRPMRSLAVSVGFGMAYATVILASLTAYGGQVMVHGLLGGDSPSSFEIAAGAALTSTEANWQFTVGSSGSDLSVTPSAFLGYRYQPMNGGFVFRVGGAWSYAIGIGVSLSFGYAF